MCRRTRGCWVEGALGRDVPMTDTANRIVRSQRRRDSAASRPLLSPGRRPVNRRGFHAGASTGDAAAKVAAAATCGPTMPLAVPVDAIVIQVFDSAMFAGFPLTPCSSSAATRGCARSSLALLPSVASPVVWRRAARRLGPCPYLALWKRRVSFSSPHLARLSFSFVAAGSWCRRARGSRDVGVEASAYGRPAFGRAASRSLVCRGREGSGG